MGGPQDRSGKVQKNSTPTEIRSPDRPARSESLYRLRHAGPHTPRRMKTTVGLLGPEEETTTILPKRRCLLTKRQVVISQRRESSSTYCREYIKGRHHMAHPSMEGIITSKLIMKLVQELLRYMLDDRGVRSPLGKATSLTLILVTNQLNAQILVL